MTIRREVFCTFLGIVIAVTSGRVWATPATTQPDIAQLLEEVRQLRTEVQELKAQRTTPAAQPIESVDDTKSAVARDAASHSYLFDTNEGFMSGFTLDRFTLQSSDGNFVLRPWLHMQFRDAAAVRKEFKPDGEDDTSNGFEMRRLRFGFDGNMFGPNLTYMLNWATVRANGTSAVTNAAGARIGTVSNNLGGVPLLEEGWAKYRLMDTSFYIKAGQIKDPVLHDQIVSSRYQQAEERSLTADIFLNGDSFTEGATVIYDPKTWLRTEGGINHGMRSANTNFLDYPTNGFNYGVAGRAEFKLMGRWQDYNMGASGVKEPLLVFGAGTDYSERGHSGQTVALLDGMYADQHGLSIYAAAVDRYTTHNFGIYTQSPTGANIGTPDPAVANAHTNEYAFVGEVGYLFQQHWEPFGRYEYMKLQGTVARSENYVQIISAGLNYYFYGHRAKLTGQCSFLPNGIPIDDGPNDIFTNNGEGEFLFDAQFQLLL
jgi:hypothetical protein